MTPQRWSITAGDPTGFLHPLVSNGGLPQDSAGITLNPQMVSVRGTERKTSLQKYRICDTYFKWMD